MCLGAFCSALWRRSWQLVVCAALFFDFLLLPPRLLFSAARWLGDFRVLQGSGVRSKLLFIRKQKNSRSLGARAAAAAALCQRARRRDLLLQRPDRAIAEQQRERDPAAVGVVWCFGRVRVRV